MSNDFHPLGQAILKDRDTRKMRQADEAAAKKQREAKPLSDFESARDIVEQSKDATKGWTKSQGGDCYTQGGAVYITSDAGATWASAMEDAGWRQPLTIAEQQDRQAADWLALTALHKSREAGTLRESLDTAIRDYHGRSMRSAMVEALTELSGLCDELESEPHPSDFGIPEDLWVNAIRYAYALAEKDCDEGVTITLLDLPEEIE